MNNKAHLRPKDFDSSGDIIPMSWKEEKGDLISREALKEVFNGYHSGIGSQPKFTLGACLQLIDNAPTVESRIDPNDIYYLCDHKRCGENFNCYECNHTSDIRHAVNFDLVEFPRSAFFEIDRPHGEWIAVNDKLPDTDGEYLVSLDNGRIVVADERGIIENHDFEPKMMAWQPLPEPYRAEVNT